jgi:hypothetical protein
LKYFCTYFDRNYLARALALIESLEQHEVAPFRLFVVCLDEITHTLLRKLANPNLVLVHLHELERGDADLVAPRHNRSRVEYYWTLTPTIILRLLDRVPVDEPLVYLDADLFFFSPSDPLLEELEGHSVLIHEHRYSPGLAHLEAESGRFNVGLLGFRNDAQARTVLAWWRERCIEWCYARPEQGKMGDQMYLDDWPTRFEGVKVLAHPGGGVAPWNHDGLAFSASPEGRPFIQGQPLVFYHFHAIVPLTREAYLPAKHLAYPLPLWVLKACYLPFVVAMERWNNVLRALLPQASFGYWPNQQVAPQNALLVQDLVAERLPGHLRIPLGQGWNLIPGTQAVLDPEPAPE